jgi:hypothetical protein
MVAVAVISSSVDDGRDELIVLLWLGGVEL